MNFKLTTALIGLSLLGAQVNAKTWTEEQRQCQDGTYCIDKLVCIGTIDNPPEHMHPSNRSQKVYAQVFKSVKNLKNGKQTLVDSLTVGSDSIGETPSMTLDEAWESVKVDDIYGNYSGPAQVRGTKVWTALGAMGFSNGLRLKITKEEEIDGQTIHTLTGYERVKGSTVGDYKLNLECRALVVEKPTIIIDRTTK